MQLAGPRRRHAKVGEPSGTRSPAAGSPKGPRGGAGQVSNLARAGLQDGENPASTRQRFICHLAIVVKSFDEPSARSHRARLETLETSPTLATRLRASPTAWFRQS